MRAVIIEDEFVAVQNLRRLIAKIDRSIEIIAVLQSIEDSVEWFSLHPSPDLVFMDIHLSDGSSFMIFDKVKIHAPIIFTTAYDEFALKAFEVNSIDYILKPINPKDLERAIKKFSNFNNANISHEEAIAKMLEMLKKQRVYKEYLLLNKGDRYIPTSVDEIAYIYSEDKKSKIITFEENIFWENCSLDKMKEMLDPSKFFRINRQFIISRKAVKDVTFWERGSFQVNLVVKTPEKIIINKANNTELKEWLQKGKET